MEMILAGIGRYMASAGLPREISSLLVFASIFGFLSSVVIASLVVFKKMNGEKVFHGVILVELQSRMPALEKRTTEEDENGNESVGY